jgi:hypothetical protein
MIPRANLPIIILPSSCSSCGKSISDEEAKQLIGKDEDCDRCGLPIYSQLHGYCQTIEKTFGYGSGRAYTHFNVKNVYHNPLCCADLKVDPEIEYVFYSQHGKIEKKIERQRSPQPKPEYLYKPAGKGCLVILVIALFFSILLYIYA